MTIRIFRFIIMAVLLTAIPLTAFGMDQAPTYQCRIVTEYPHDIATSTQGIFFHDSYIFESSGGFSQSFLTMVDLETGHHIRTQPIPGKYFAEGIAPYKNALFMLTWMSGKGYIHDLETLAPISSFTYRPRGTDTEGWGIAFDGQNFIVSSGTAKLNFHRPDDFALTGSIIVQDGKDPVRQLNELEYVGGMLLANIWKSDTIAVIDPNSGTVTAWIDLTPLRKSLSMTSGVANGIAYNKATGQLYVTGKHWNKLFEITVDEALWRHPVQAMD